MMNIEKGEEMPKEATKSEVPKKVSEVEKLSEEREEFRKEYKEGIISDYRNFIEKIKALHAMPKSHREFFVKDVEELAEKLDSHIDSGLGLKLSKVREVLGIGITWSTEKVIDKSLATIEALGELYNDKEEGLEFSAVKDKLTDVITGATVGIRRVDAQGLPTALSGNIVVYELPRELGIAAREKLNEIESIEKNKKSKE